jgi:hypothetical protein
MWLGGVHRCAFHVRFLRAICKFDCRGAKDTIQRLTPCLVSWGTGVGLREFLVDVEDHIVLACRLTRLCKLASTLDVWHLCLVGMLHCSFRVCGDF